MLSHSHALSGAVTGAGVGIFLHFSDPRIMALSAFTAGMALLPDLDSCGSSPSRSLGFLSGAVSHVIRFVSGGHRHATHAAVGVAAFTLLAWVACHYRYDWGGQAGLALLIALTVSAGFEALHVFRNHAADALGIAVAATVVVFGWGLSLIALAVLIGCLTHIAGDMLTDSGCMLAYPASDYRFHLLPESLRFSTGHAAEHFVVTPVLVLALAALAIQAADPALLASGWHAFTSAA